MAGRVELVKSVIPSMLTYSMLLYLWPSALLNQLDQWIINFIWSGNLNTKKVLTVAWHKVCLPVEEVGYTLP